MNSKNNNSKTSTIGSRKSKIFFYGFILWTLWIVIYLIILKYQTGISWSNAAISSSQSNYIFALLGIGIWFNCRKIPLGIMPMGLFLLIHFLLAISYSALWIFLSYGLWYLFEGKRIFQIVPIETYIGWQFLFGMIMYFLVAGIFYTIIYYKQYREKELRETELKLLKRDAEFRALKMQVNPHFLFNSLNSINALVKKNPEQARDMIAKLSDLLRMSLESRDEMLVPLKEELELARLYLEIEEIRFGDRMVIHEEIDPELLDNAFPAMILQPLLENAIKHGIADHRGKGSIQISLKRRDNHLRCTVSNTIRKGHKRDRMKSTNDGTGLANIRRRLDLFYSDQYDFKADYLDSEWYEVTLSLPLNRGEGKENPR